MRRCLDCEYLNSYILRDKTLPEMFQSMLYLECKKYKKFVFGYDNKRESGDCIGFVKRKEQP